MQFCSWCSHRSHLPRNSARGENGGFFLQLQFFPFLPHTIPLIAAVSMRRFLTDRHRFVSCHTLHFVFRCNEPAIPFFSLTSIYQFCAHDGRASVALLPPNSPPPLPTHLQNVIRQSYVVPKLLSGKLMHHLLLPPRPLSRKSISFRGWLRQ